MQVKNFINYTLILSLIVLTGCHQKSAQTKAEKAPEWVVAARSEPVKPQPTKLEPVKPDTVKPDTMKPDTVKPDTVKPDTVKPDTVKPDTVKPDTVKPDTVKPDTVKPDTVKPDTVKPDTVKPDTVKPDKVKSEAIKLSPALKIAGQVSLDQSKLNNKNAEINQTIVYFEPSNAKISPLPKTNAVISTLNKQFKPNVLAITAGSQIRFPNKDRILHNVFSISPENEFDLGLYPAGSSEVVTFNEPGVIYVHCNVHHHMQADILVLETPYFTQVDDQGYFELNGLPELAGTLKTWHPQGHIESLLLTEHIDHQSINKIVNITRPKVPEHRNKFGRPYRRTRY